MTTTSQSQNRYLHRIRALMAKAESTPFAEEAAALTAKAYELMAAHAIDLAMIEAREGRGEVTIIHIVVPAPYAKEKFSVLSSVAGANRCRAILGVDAEGAQAFLADEALLAQLDEGKPATVVGHRADLDVVELLFTSLLVQAVNIMLQQGSRSPQWDRNGSETRSFRRSFLVGFAGMVAERLEESQQRSTATAQNATAGEVLPVLANRTDRVDRAVDELFPQLRTMATTVRSGEGLMAGRRAGRQADLGTSRLTGSRALIPTALR